MTTEAVVRVGVIGAGRIGRLHAANLASRIPAAEVAGVADIDLAAAQSVARQWHVPRADADYRRLLDDPTISAVAICSATNTHSNMICEAAAAGKHIFCEKPIDFDLGRIDRALAAVASAGVTLQVGFNRRFDANFRQAQRMVAAGQIGTPHVLRITSRDPAPPPLEYVRASGGLFLDMTIHDFDMARFLIGSEVTEVYTLGAVRVDPAIGEAGDLDTAIVSLRFANGVLGTIDNSRRAVYGYDQRVEVFGEGGMVAVGNNTADQHVLSNAEGVHSAKPLYFFLERYNESYVAELQAFVDSVLGGTPPPVTGRDGRVPVVMGLAARRSYDLGRPVKLSEIEGA
jgi:myo-inositol 2-dehydrogenase / D-chiro-inositol 1-dehydrogenase